MRWLSFYRKPTVPDLLLVIGANLALVAIVVEVMTKHDDLILPTLAIAVLAGLGSTAIRLGRLAWWRITGETVLVQRVFAHVDERLGAAEWESIRATKIKRWMDLFTGNIAGFIRPVRIKGMVQMTRMRRYVELEFKRPFAGRRFTKHDIAIVWLRWTSEAFINSNNYFRIVEMWVAQALIGRWHEGMFVHRFDREDEDVVGFQRREPVMVGSKVGAEEDLEDEDG